MSRLVRDCSGSSLVEFTLVLPVLFIVALGTIDFTYMLYEWMLANKAAYSGARYAAVNNPVSPDLANPTYNAPDLGKFCFNPTTGVTTGLCPTFNYVCTSPNVAASCPNYDATAFNNVVASMQQVFPRLQAGHVRIRYETTGLGFVGRPGGVPMNVTVSLQCLTHQFFFIHRLMQWVFSAPAVGCPAGAAGPPIPAFASTLSSEDLATN